MTDCTPYKNFVYDPYCGTNGVTYENKCELYNAICKSGKAFGEQGSGKCKAPCATCGLNAGSGESGGDSAGLPPSGMYLKCLSQV